MELPVKDLYISVISIPAKPRTIRLKDNEMVRFPVPVYALYGETGSDLIPDVLHFETIAERSRQHDWRIRPHRHQGLSQFFLLQSGRSRVLVDGRDFVPRTPVVLFIPSLLVHGFDMDPRTDGAVVTIADPHLARLVGSAPAAQSLLRAPSIVAISLRKPESAAFGALFAGLGREFRDTGTDRSFALQALVGLIAVRLARLRPETGAEAGVEASHACLREFRQMVEAHYADGWSVADYARRLGVSPATLTRVCRAALGVPPYRAVLDRMLLEAKRELVYTSKTVGEVALALGYDDIAYFSRWFARATGRPPSRYRADARRELRIRS